MNRQAASNQLKTRFRLMVRMRLEVSNVSSGEGGESEVGSGPGAWRALSSGWWGRECAGAVFGSPASWSRRNAAEQAMSMQQGKLRADKSRVVVDGAFTGLL